MVTQREACAGDEVLRAWITQAAQSYETLRGAPLFEGGGEDDFARAEHAPFALLMHNGGEDPVFQYANVRARALFAYTLEEFRRLPSRLSAEPERREARARMLKAASEQGYFEGYRGIRIAKDGRRFRIADAIIWQIYDAEGQVIGQAAKIPRVEAL